MIMDTCGLNEQEFELVRAAADAAVCRWQSAITQHPSTATTASTRHGHSTTTSSSAAAAGGGGGASAVLLPAAAAAAASTSHTAAAAAAGSGGGGASGGGQQQQLQELGRQLLQCAADGAVEQLELLMQRGAPLTSDWLGTSPLHMAAMYGHRPVAEALLSAGVVRDVRTKVDKTPLHFAAAEGFVDIVRLLLCNGASVDLRDMLNMTALHWAVQRGQTACAELLLQHGASVHVRNKFDKTPVDIAADTSHSQLLRILNNSERYLLESGLAGAVNSASVTTTTTSSSSAVQSSSATTSSSAAAAAADAEIQPAVDSILNDMALSDTASSTTNTVHKQQQHHQQLKLPSSGLHNQNTSPNKVAVGQSSHSQPGLAVLASHGITILPSDDSCLLPSALTAGRRVSLTAAGALALGQTLPSGSPLEPLPTSNTATAAFPTASASVLGGGDGEGGARAKTGVAVATSGGRKVTKVIRLTSNQLAKLTGRSGNPTIRLSTSSGVLASSPAPATPQPSTSSASSSSTPLVSSSSSHYSRNTPPLLHSSSLSSSSGSVHSPSLKKLKFVPYQNGDTPPSAPATAPSTTAASATPVHLTGDQSPVWALNGATNRCTISSATQTVQHSTQSVGVCTELSLSQDTAFLASMPVILSPTSAATNTIATTAAAAAAEQTLDPFPDCLLDINSECGDRFAPPPAAGGAAAAAGGGGGEGQFMEEEEEDGDEDADTWDRSTLARRLSRAEQLASSYQLRAERCRARASRYRRLLAAKHPR